MTRWFGKLRMRLGQFEAKTLIGGLSLVASAWLFIWIADEISEGDGRSLDVGIMQWLRQADDPGMLVGPDWLAHFATQLTALGSGPVLIVVAVGVVGFLLTSESWQEALFMAVAAAGGALFNDLLKALFERPRPDVVPHLVEVTSFSFPSGHSMASATIYLVIGAIGASLVPKKRQKMYLMAVAVSLTVVIGLTRIILGVHYPSDVLAGWSVGWGWAIACWMVHDRLQGRVLEPPKGDED